MSKNYILYCRFNPKTYRAIRRRLNCSHTPKYITSYANLSNLIKFNFRNLSLLHQEEVTMVGEGGRSESKTAYFYEIAQDSTFSVKENICDYHFRDACIASSLDVGDRYQLLINQRLQYENKFTKIVTRNTSKEDANEYFIGLSDAETVE